MGNENEKSPEDLQSEELNSWISTIPFSKPKKNLTRDFSDAVLMAEVLKVYYPRHVDLHNYVPASSLSTKKENWSMLNRKVLTKIDMKLTKETIHQLANSHPGAAEHLLLKLKSKALNNSSCGERERDSFEEDRNGENDSKAEGNFTSSSPTDLSASKALKSKESAFTNVRNGLYFVFCWIISWLCFWNYFPSMRLQSLRIPFRNSRKEDANASRTPANANTRDETAPHHVCEQLKQELYEKEDIICTLNHKVTYLESAIKLRDLRISNLTTQILQNAVESEQITKIQTSNDLQTKSRPRSQIVREKSKMGDS